MGDCDLLSEEKSEIIGRKLFMFLLTQIPVRSVLKSCIRTPATIPVTVRRNNHAGRSTIFVQVYCQYAHERMTVQNALEAYFAGWFSGRNGYSVTCCFDISDHSYGAGICKFEVNFAMNLDEALAVVDCLHERIDAH